MLNVPDNYAAFVAYEEEMERQARYRYRMEIEEDKEDMDDE